MWGNAISMMAHKQPELGGGIKKYVYLTSSGSGWTKPGDFPTSGSVTIHAIGPGGYRGGGSRGGGGGGAYAAVTVDASTLTGSESYVVTNGGSVTVTSQSTSFASILVADRGLNASSTATAGTGGKAVNCIGDVAFDGGNGGTGGSSGFAGGGGAAGPDGAGKNGGNGSSGGRGGGGGGCNGGLSTAGVNATSSVIGSGGTGPLGDAGGAPGINGANGSGGGGGLSTVVPGNGSIHEIWDTGYGPASGQGGSSAAATPASLWGAGGSQTQGGAGLIVIEYEV